ncbi:MAG: hypothetical protein PHY99_06660 [Bacteroidales bacterium]|nr:hypothetical protein [Bacteroidales bacterium]
MLNYTLLGQLPEQNQQEQTMIKTLLAVTITTLLTVHSYGQNQCDIKNHYEDFISIQKSTYNEKDYLIKRIIETERKSCFSDFVNNNKVFIDYLLTNFSSNSNSQNLLQLTDSTTIRNNYFLDLKKDSLFNSVMAELVCKTIDKNVPKDTVPMDKLLNIAVKFFSIMRITDEGLYVGKVCVGLNDIKKTESERKPFVEAFSFASIMKHYKSEEFSMYDEFVKAIKELYKVNLGINKDEKLLRAQGAMFLLMRNNENLKKMLKTEFEKQKENLPFILTN